MFRQIGANWAPPGECQDGQYCCTVQQQDCLQRTPGNLDYLMVIEQQCLVPGYGGFQLVGVPSDQREIKPPGLIGSAARSMESRTEMPRND